MGRWYLQHPGGAPVGPLGAAEVQAAWSRREIDPDTMVCAEGLATWARIIDVAELVGSPPTTAQPAQQVVPTGAGGAKSRLTAILGG